MVTFSLCMIVKNEENVLARCLDSIADIMDEIIIVDTGSTDRTKEIALTYTDKVYDFKWTGSFADARNYASAKASMDYIYTADADEYLEKADHDRLAALKNILMTEIEIVQMLYCTPKELSSVYNFEEEYRPKLYKRIRKFTWIDPIHETLRIDPIVYDSEIRVQHRPQAMHTDRDIKYLEAVAVNGKLSKKLHHMYAMELFKSGTDNDFIRAIPAFGFTMEQDYRSMDEIKEAVCVLAKAYHVKGNIPRFLGYALKDAVSVSTAEMCCELGKYYEEIGDLKEAAIWYQNALTETECILDIKCGSEIPQAGLERCKVQNKP